MARYCTTINLVFALLFLVGSSFLGSHTTVSGQKETPTLAPKTPSVKRYFFFIKKQVSSDWKDLAECLEFETPDIENIDGKHRDDKSRCMELLQQWYKREGNAATIHVLMEALQEADLKHVVDSLKDRYPELKDKPLSPTGSSKWKSEDLPVQPVASGNQQKNPAQTMPDQQSMEIEPKATNTGEVRQSVVMSPWLQTQETWMKKVSFGGKEGSGRGEFAGPSGVAVSKGFSEDNETICIADLSNMRIQVFTMDGVYIREFKTTVPGTRDGMLSPRDVALGRYDNLWVVSSKYVVSYSIEGFCEGITDLPNLYHKGITVAMAKEQVIVTDYEGQNGLLRVFDDGYDDGYDNELNEVGTYGLGHRSPKPWDPQYVTVDGEGNILVTDYNNHCVHVFDKEGNFKFKFGSEGSHESQFKDPQGICVDAMGNIIVADYGNGCVKMFDSQGRFLSFIAIGMKDPRAVAVSSDGDVVVTDVGDNTVSVWTQR